MSHASELAGLREELGRLQARLTATQKVNAVLMDRVERSVDHMGNAFSMFESNILLQTKVDKRTEELAHARNVAIAASKSKSKFLANMSHEIRTPMNAIIGMTHLALQTELSPQQYDYISKANSAAHALLGIINDILDFSKIDAGKMRLEHVDFDLEEVFNHLSLMCEAKAQEKGLELYFHLDADVPRCLVGDALRLGQILLNLLSNALKFSAYGEIVVDVQIASASKDLPTDQIMLEMTVEDCGIGLSKHQIGSLFQSFSQADSSTTRKYGGTGLGLTISKQLVELMGGTMSVHSEQGKGSCFSFTAVFGLPAEDKSFASAQQLAGMRVLVVDDSRVSRQIMISYMQRFSLQVDTVASGEEALQRLKTVDKPYQLILIDYQMPGMNGIETTRCIRNLSTAHAIPTIIMVTAHAKDMIMQQAKDASLDGFLIKPVGQSVLFETLMSTFGYDMCGKHRKKAHIAKYRKDLATLRGAHILLVEDNAINQQIACEVLQQEGLVVTLACNGREAVEKLAIDRFDAVLMDLQMPEMDGYEATRMIRSEARFKDLPIIAMTAHAMLEEKEKCLAAGMNAHTSKPIDLDHLFAVLQQWISLDAQQDRHMSEQCSAPLQAIKAYFPEQLAGFDVPKCLKSLGGQTALLHSLLQDFYRDYSAIATEIRDLLAIDDVQAAARLTHTIKGVAGNLYASELYHAAQQLDEALQHAELKVRWPALLDAFEMALSVSMASIAGLPSQDSNIIADKAVVEDLLAELKRLIAKNSMDVDRPFQLLQVQLQADFLQQEMQQLETDLNHFDFDAAALTLQIIAGHFGKAGGVA